MLIKVRENFSVMLARMSGHHDQPEGFWHVGWVAGNGWQAGRALHGPHAGPSCSRQRAHAARQGQQRSAPEQQLRAARVLPQHGQQPCPGLCLAFKLLQPQSVLLAAAIFNSIA